MDARGQGPAFAGQAPDRQEPRPKSKRYCTATGPEKKSLYNARFFATIADAFEKTLNMFSEGQNRTHMQILCRIQLQIML